MSRSRWLLLGAALAALALVVLSLVDPRAAAQGWLMSFVASAAPVLGAIALSLIAGLTGGRWGELTRPITSAAPALLILSLPIWLTLEWVYPWARGEGGSGHAPEYLRGVFFTGRGVAALAIWATLAWFLARGRTSQLVLGLGLLAHAVLVIATGVDWILSLRPGWIASDFGMNLAAQQIAAGAAVAVLVAGRSGTDDELGDLSTLVLAGVLGVAYLAFMDYLVVWYGNLPDKVVWYVRRAHGPFPSIALATVLVGVVGPAVIAALRLPRAAKARIIAVLALAGLALYELYLFAPVVGWLSLLAAVLALLTQGAALGWAAPRLRACIGRGGLSHG